jgi:hypothetical protein
MLDDPTIVGIAALAVLAVVLILYMARGRGQDLAGALERRGWLLYVRDGCGYCTQQKDMFKNGFRAIVKCGAPPPPGAALPPVVGAPPTCQDPRITGFPYWFNTQTGVSKVGLQNLNALRQMAH